ncbi:MAG TPA: hypothetical protein VII92_04845, partial [Anaerolineae bacterium]
GRHRRRRDGNRPIMAAEILNSIAVINAIAPDILIIIEAIGGLAIGLLLIGLVSSWTDNNRGMRGK